MVARPYGSGCLQGVILAAQADVEAPRLLCAFLVGCCAAPFLLKVLYGSQPDHVPVIRLILLRDLTTGECDQ